MNCKRSSRKLAHNIDHQKERTSRQTVCIMKKLSILCLSLMVLGCEQEPVCEGKTFSYWQKELKNKDATGRMRAAAVMNILGQRARPAMPDLIECLADSDYVVRYEAALALGRIGPFAEPAVPALTKLLNDRVRHVRQAAATALEQIEPGKEHGGQSKSSGTESEANGNNQQTQDTRH